MRRSLLVPTAVTALALLACNKPAPEPAGAAPVTESATADSAVGDSDAADSATDSVSATDSTAMPADSAKPD
jgi:hypothetical protein